MRVCCVGLGMGVVLEDDMGGRGGGCGRPRVNTWAGTSRPSSPRARSRLGSVPRHYRKRYAPGPFPRLSTLYLSDLQQRQQSSTAPASSAGATG